jgi:transcriptional regulator with XRE-family HTH domain
LLQKELATQTGIATRTIQDIERGPDTLRLSPSNAQKISAVTGVSTEYLLANDPKREITNTAGEPWSEKDVKAIRQRNEKWPALQPLALKFLADFYHQLFLDHFYLRCLLLATPNPSAALESWRYHREKAWVEFLKEWPEAKVAKEDLPWSDWQETIKQDLDLVLAHPYGPFSEAERELFDAHLSGNKEKTGEKMFDSDMEWIRSPSARRRSDTFWGTPYWGPRAKTVDEAMTAIGPLSEILKGMEAAGYPQEELEKLKAAMVEEGGTKPAQEAKNEGAPAKRRGPKRQR